MTRAEQRITLLIWIVSICIALLTLTKLFALANWLLHALVESL